ncbi:hypothetical protein CXY01_29550 [Cellulomonas xylanilytica]|uniref:Uncharacterized protein n=1 Tax=Cellulomonas xylanilytica TaxID=233583 RepID=A0A510VBA9_9CELL|nr:hypothetical protein CXY01_29550 [Cellulomonas xylanilytica]
MRVSVPGTMQSRLDHTRSEPDVMTISRCASPASTRHASVPVLVIETVNVALTPGANVVASGVMATATVPGSQVMSLGSGSEVSSVGAVDVSA